MEPFPFDTDNFYESFVLIYKNAFLAMKKGLTEVFKSISTLAAKEDSITTTLKKKRA